MSTKKTIKPQCILHIGMPKTGSSSIQKYLYEIGENSEFKYPQLDLYTDHGPLIYLLFSEDKTKFNANFYGKESDDQLDELKQYYKNQLRKVLLESKLKKLIFSSEDFLFLSPNSLIKLKAFLSKFVSEIKILAYVRTPISFTQSAFQQNVKTGHLSIDLAIPRYKEWFEKLDPIFGRDNVSLIKFDASTLLGGDVVTDFCAQININTNNVNYIRTNETLSLEAVALLYVFHRYSTPAEKSKERNLIVHALIESLSNIGRRKFKFSNTLVKSILNNNASDIQWMESRLGTSLAEKLANDSKGISTEDDLIAAAMESINELCTLIAKKMQPQFATPQAIAWGIEQLNNPLLLKLISATKTSQDSDFKYSIDMLQDEYIMGWIVDMNHPLKKISIELSQDGRLIATGIANQFRQDLANAVIADGNCAFRLKTEFEPTIDGGPLTLRVIEVEHKFEIQPTAINGLI